MAFCNKQCIKCHLYNTYCRFIYAFGGAGLFLFLTAISGLYGSCYNSRHCLNFYSTMVVVMLLAQCALLVAYFADQSWKKKLPHDDTGEAAKVTFQLKHMHFLCMYLCMRPIICQDIMSYAVHVIKSALHGHCAFEAVSRHQCRPCIASRNCMPCSFTLENI